MEKNNLNKRQLTVMHVRDTRDGPKPLRDQADIDMRISNVASKQSRGLILAMMPKWLVEDAVQECRKTLAGKNDEPLESRVRKMAGAFAKFGVTAGHLESYLGHKLENVLLDELIDLQGVYNSLRDGTPASELFGKQEEEAQVAKTAVAALVDTAKKAVAQTQRQPSAKAAAAQPPAAAAPAQQVQPQEAPGEPAAPASEPAQAAQGQPNEPGAASGPAPGAQKAAAADDFF